MRVGEWGAVGAKWALAGGGYLCTLLWLTLEPPLAGHVANCGAQTGGRFPVQSSNPLFSGRRKPLQAPKPPLPVQEVRLLRMWTREPLFLKMTPLLHLHRPTPEGLDLLLLPAGRGPVAAGLVPPLAEVAPSRPPLRPLPSLPAPCAECSSRTRRT